MSRRTILWRGMRRRCAVCGSGRLFEGWFRMRPHCPTCATRFEREPGFFVGALFVNFAITEVVMFAYLAGAAVATLPSPDARTLIAGSAAICVVQPVLLYPFSKTVWFAIHVVMQPLDPKEEADAAAVRFERGDVVTPGPVNGS